ncbi:C6 finger domain protein [Thozetella sp. PMI_491]|nr:C6 finger domain protein [Thozetella sp. PMI_491]
MGQKRGPYRKSPKGCRNCKLRKIKCDGTRPHCQRCQAYGVICNFSGDVFDLQLKSGTSSRAAGAKSRAVCLREMTWSLYGPLSSDNSITGAATLFPLDAKSLDLLHHLQTRPVFTAADPKMTSLYRTEVSRLACYYPFLMHGMLALAGAHRRFLSQSETARSVTELYHYSQCTSLLNQKLQKPILPDDRDPIWAAATIVSIISFAQADLSAPEAAWPLKISDSSDLEWLQMSEGKYVLWQLTNPLRQDSIFCKFARIYTEADAPLPKAGIDGIPEALVDLCMLNDSSNAENHPYFAAVHGIVRLQNTLKEEVTLAKALSFISQAHRPFKALLQCKDPVALLLLAQWYDELPEEIWWMQLRTRVEIRTISVYLKRFYPGLSRHS